ncbi:MAG: hypothetical protein ACK40L_03990, partial [Hydrogenophaga sp.]
MDAAWALRGGLGLAVFLGPDGSTRSLACFCRTGFLAQRAHHEIIPLRHQTEIDATTVQVHPADLDIHPRTQGITDTGAFATQLLPSL